MVWLMILSLTLKRRIAYERNTHNLEQGEKAVDDIIEVHI